MKAIAGVYLRSACSHMRLSDSRCSPDAAASSLGPLSARVPRAELLVNGPPIFFASTPRWPSDGCRHRPVCHDVALQSALPKLRCGTCPSRFSGPPVGSARVVVTDRESWASDSTTPLLLSGRGADYREAGVVLDCPAQRIPRGADLPRSWNWYGWLPNLSADPRSEARTRVLTGRKILAKARLPLCPADSRLVAWSLLGAKAKQAPTRSGRCADGGSTA